MAEHIDLARDYPCTWDQNETLTSTHDGVLKPNPVLKTWLVRDGARLDDVERAWRTVVTRHPALRVAYRQHRPGYWTYRVLPCAVVESWFTVLDHPDDERVAALRSQVGLHTGQLFAVIVVRHPEGLVIHVVLDHICADGWSLAVIIDEWGRIIDRAPASAEPIDDEFFRHCLDHEPKPETKTRLADELARVPPQSFPPYAEPPLTLRTPPAAYAVEAAKTVVPWNSFPFDARACAAGIGPALLTQGLNLLYGSDSGQPQEFPLVAGVAARRTHAQQRSVGMYFSWLMLSVPVGESPLVARARSVHGRVLATLRRPPVPFALDSAIRVPDVAGARHWPYSRSPRYLYANHLTPRPPLVVGGRPAETVPSDEKIQGFGLARVVSKPLADGLELEFVARADLLAEGITGQLVRYAHEAIGSRPAISGGRV